MVIIIYVTIIFILLVCYCYCYQYNTYIKNENDIEHFTINSSFFSSIGDGLKSFGNTVIEVIEHPIDNRQTLLSLGGAIISVAGAATCWTGVGCALIPVGAAVSSIAAVDQAVEGAIDRHDMCLDENLDVYELCKYGCEENIDYKNESIEILSELNDYLWPDGALKFINPKVNMDLTSSDISELKSSIKDYEKDIKYYDRNYKGCLKHCNFENDKAIKLCSYSNDWKEILADSAVAAASVALAATGIGGAVGGAAAGAESAAAQGAKIIGKEVMEETSKVAAEKAVSKGATAWIKSTSKELIKDTIKSVKNPKTYLNLINEYGDNIKGVATSLTDKPQDYSLYVSNEEENTNSNGKNNTININELPYFKYQVNPSEGINLKQSELQSKCPDGGTCKYIPTKVASWPTFNWHTNRNIVNNEYPKYKNYKGLEFNWDNKTIIGDNYIDSPSFNYL